MLPKRRSHRRGHIAVTPPFGGYHHYIRWDPEEARASQSRCPQEMLRWRLGGALTFAFDIGTCPDKSCQCHTRIERQIGQQGLPKPEEWLESADGSARFDNLEVIGGLECAGTWIAWYVFGSRVISPGSPGK
jgi:hypothetical protein